jgi:hypothetical protein
MDVGQLDRDRLYDLYTRYHARLRADVVRVNSSLGSATPEKTRLEMLQRPMFDSLVEGSATEPEVVHRFILRIVRGHEQEFPELRVA